MKIIKPYTVTNSNLTSNVAITETEWTAGTYSLGDQRYLSSNFTLYEVIVASTSDSPDVGVLADPPTWKSLGKINRWKMFDQKVGNATTNSTSIDITITKNSVLNGIALFNCLGSTAQIIVNDSIEGIVYDQTIPLVDNSSVVDWYTYFFEDIVVLQDVVKTDLPAYGSTATVQVIVSAPTGTAQLGELVVGTISEFGQDIALGSGFGTIDYSRKTTDVFGNFEIEERGFAKRGDYLIQIDKSLVSTVQKVLTSIRTTPVVFIGADTEEYSIIYGFYKDFFIVISTPTLISFNLSVEGLT